jgi:hypothetical protein
MGSGLVAQGESYAAIESKVKQGFNGGDWRGDGITSSVAASDPRGATALGMADDPAGVLVKYTLYGDADLNNVVDVDDFSNFTSGFNSSATSNWAGGDFNYSDQVDVTDFDLFLAGLRGQGYASPDLFDALRTFTTDHGIQVDLSTVPEPAVLHIVVLGTVGWITRRRRK